MADYTRKNLFDDGYTTYHDDGSKSYTQKDLFGDGYTTYNDDGSKSYTQKNLFDDGYTTYHDDGSKSHTQKDWFGSGYTTYHDDGSKSYTDKELFGSGYNTYHSSGYSRIDAAIGGSSKANNTGVTSENYAIDHDIYQYYDNRVFAESFVRLSKARQKRENRALALIPGIGIYNVIQFIYSLILILFYYRSQGNACNGSVKVQIAFFIVAIANFIIEKILMSQLYEFRDSLKLNKLMGSCNQNMFDIMFFTELMTFSYILRYKVPLYLAVFFWLAVIVFMSLSVLYVTTFMGIVLSYFSLIIMLIMQYFTVKENMGLYEAASSGDALVFYIAASTFMIFATLIGFVVFVFDSVKNLLSRQQSSIHTHVENTASSSTTEKREIKSEPSRETKIKADTVKEQKVKWEPEKEQISVPKISDNTTAKADQLKRPRKIYPNDPCPCGSGKKYKECHGKAIYQ